MIKCHNVQEQASDLSELILEQWRRAMIAGDFVLGEEVTRFEAWMSQRCGGAYAVSVNSGTDALVLALRALGIGAGDEVITCSNTFIATVGAILAVGARAILADVDEDELMNVETIARVANAHTKAVIPVHLRGRPVEMASVLSFCRAREISVIEDCAQAIGTTINGRHVGTFGDASAFSFHPLKTLGALGDGGVLVTNNLTIAKYATSARNHGLHDRGQSSAFGGNSRMDTLQAAALNVKAQYLDQWLLRRKQIAAFYDAALAHTRTSADPGHKKAGSSYYHYVVKSGHRDTLRQHLGELGIQAMIHYPTPVHHQEAWLRSQSPISLPSTERLAREILTIPCHQHLTDGEVERIATAIRRFDSR